MGTKPADVQPIESFDHIIHFQFSQIALSTFKPNGVVYGVVGPESPIDRRRTPGGQLYPNYYYYAFDCRSGGERLPWAQARGLRPSRPCPRKGCGGHVHAKALFRRCCTNAKKTRSVRSDQTRKKREINALSIRPGSKNVDCPSQQKC